MLKALKDLLDSITEFLKALGPLEVSLFLLLLAAGVFLADKYVFLEHDIIHGMTSTAKEWIALVRGDGNGN